MRRNMRAERARNGLSAEKAAKAIGVHPNTLRNWESGESEPTAGNLIALSTLYHCTPEYLLGMTDSQDGVAIAEKS